MKRLTIFGLMLFIGIFFATANSHAALEEGTKEVSAFGAHTTTDPEEGDSSTQLIVQVSGGVFLDPKGQVGGSFTLITSESGGVTAAIRLITGFYKYHLSPEEEVVPYIGGQVGLAFAEAGGESASATAYGGMFGVKNFLSEDLSVNIEYNILFTTLTYDNVDYDVTQTTIQAGMSYYF